METAPIPRPFDFTRDGFAFANELVWEYRADPATGRMNFRPRESKPAYAHRCFVLARAARQFLYHARFEPTQAVADKAAYRRLIRAVMRRNPRKPCAAKDQIVIPGHTGLRDFSSTHEKLLKAECGGAWQSYILRSHWRMIFPISRNHQAQTAAQLAQAVQQNIASICHLVKFPSLTINHGMVIFAAHETGSYVEFSAYDPNDPAQPAKLTFDRATRSFSLPPNHYWAGGAVNIIEIYRSWWM